MGEQSAGGGPSQAGFGCLAVLIVIGMAAAIMAVVFAWNVNAPG